MPNARVQLATVFVAVAVALGGCDVASQMKDGMASSAATADAIASQIGKRPEVGFNYSNGSFVQATVQFAETPAIPLPELERLVRAAVVKQFKSEPAVLVIAFAYPKAQPSRSAT
jgi:hypothetical protein